MPRRERARFVDDDDDIERCYDALLRDTARAGMRGDIL